MKQYFKFEGAEEQVQLTVISQMSYKYDAQTIQISKVKDPDTNAVRFVYEEIENGTDTVMLCRYMGEDNIRNNYPWAVTMLPCKPLTKKQAQMMYAIKVYLDVFGGEQVRTDEFITWAFEEYGFTKHICEGLLSSLWVKGYINCNALVGKGTRLFRLEPFGAEYILGEEIRNHKPQPPEESSEDDASENPEEQPAAEEPAAEEKPKRKRSRRSKKAEE